MHQRSFCQPFLPKNEKTQNKSFRKFHSGERLSNRNVGQVASRYRYHIQNEKRVAA